MDWLIWVIVIVLVVAAAWWILNRNSAKSSAGVAPSSPNASSRQMDDATTLTSSAPNAPSGQGLAEPRVPEPAPEPDGGDVDDWEHPSPSLGPEAEATTGPPATGTADMVEKIPNLETEVSGTAGSGEAMSPTEPVIDETEPIIDGGVTADDTALGQPGPPVPPVSAPPEAGTPEQKADEAEWEATWSEGSTQATATQKTQTRPVHHDEYTDAHAPTLPGAESAAAETADAVPKEDAREAAKAPATATSLAEATPFNEHLVSGHLAGGQPYGEGSVTSAADGSGPDGYPIKGNPDTMTYHDEDSPGYDDAKAAVWFVSSAHAEAAGFRPPRRSRR